MTVYLESLASNKTTLSEVFFDYPGVAIPMLEACENIMRGPSTLAVVERELIAAFVSGLKGCPHCTAVHTSTTETLGTPKGLVDAMLRNLDTADVDAKMMPILQYVRKLTLTPSALSQSDADAVYAAGWEEGALHDAAAICALFHFFNLYVLGVGLGDNEHTASRGKAIANYGYAIMIDKLKLREK